MESDYKKYKFSEIFKENLDGSLTPIKPIQINGVTFRSSTSFQKGVAFGGIDFHLYKNRDIAAKEENDILNFIGFFKEPVDDNYVRSNP
ncbi:hypothetical protein A2640_02225 [Candidatus Nomurabacteria bacterium RIFCSPHIGHO2_01_FULL_36_23]|nr:MAG: hypothetical protein A2640_02225 [Candidatus Nomurabacteria bacterium RIFCSPHIGHO2_01_FULL_36_23]